MKPYLFLIVVIPLFLSLSSCEDIFSVEILGDGNIRSEKRIVGEIDRVLLESDFDLQIRQGLSGSLTVEADSNILSYVVSEVNNGTLELGVKQNFSIVPRQSVRITLEAGNLSEVAIINGGRVQVDTFRTSFLRVNVYEVSTFKADSLICENLAVVAEGSTTVAISGNFDNLWLHQIGSGNMQLKGKANEGDVVVEGSGMIKAGELGMANGDLRLYGSGLILCRVSGLLKTYIDGNGRIYYYGMPENLTKEISGEGLVLPAEED
ncbi:GIN domain-containing protein [Thermophagus sp. OGC60D27]|uniref:GIN domain-containing protein n=1 Tax=Thermophagus sp. OGC60D27 TaxID=3458415 RepID=UPI004037831C